MKGCIELLPAVSMLTASFFVAYIVSKCDSKGLKLYGKIIVALLVLVALALIACGIAKLTGCGQGMVCPMPGK